MKHQVQVKIERYKDTVTVSNEFGKKWTFFVEEPKGLDYSVTTAIAEIATSMLSGTISAHLKELNSPKLTYTLTIEA